MLKNRNIKRKKNQGIIELARSLQALTKEAVIIYERELDEIVGSGCRDKRRIESTLDWMLGFCCDEDMLTLYRKLCRYYYNIDPKATAGHIRAYRDMWDPDEKKEWLKATNATETRQKHVIRGAKGAVKSVTKSI